jgi:hypothetical protein
MSRRIWTDIGRPIQRIVWPARTGDSVTAGVIASLPPGIGQRTHWHPTSDSVTLFGVSA